MCFKIPFQEAFEFVCYRFTLSTLPHKQDLFSPLCNSAYSFICQIYQNQNGREPDITISLNKIQGVAICIGSCCVQAASETTASAFLLQKLQLNNVQKVIVTFWNSFGAVSLHLINITCCCKLEFTQPYLISFNIEVLVLN